METAEAKPIVILMADDDDDDYVLTKKALGESRLLNTLMRVRDGEELMDYLHRRGDYNAENAPRPGVICSTLICRVRTVAKR